MQPVVSWEDGPEAERAEEERAVDTIAKPVRRVAEGLALGAHVAVGRGGAERVRPDSPEDCVWSEERHDGGIRGGVGMPRSIDDRNSRLKESRVTSVAADPCYPVYAGMLRSRENLIQFPITVISWPISPVYLIYVFQK